MPHSGAIGGGRGKPSPPLSLLEYALETSWNAFWLVEFLGQLGMRCFLTSNRREPALRGSFVVPRGLLIKPRGIPCDP